MNPKKMIAMLMALCLLLCGCRRETDPTGTTEAAASRMVRQITISITPADPDFDRVYASRESLDTLLQMLRNMQTEEAPETTPDLNSGQTYYTITAVYTNGQSAKYYLLGHRYLQMGGEWCVVSTQNVLEFNDYLRTNPSDDSPGVRPDPTESLDPSNPTELKILE